MKVYISLPVTGVKGYKERAEAIEKLLTEAGQTVINPVTICEKLPEKTTHNEYMSICLPLVDMCDAIVFDEGWESSRGCNLEMVRAMENKIEIGFIRENTWENQNKPEGQRTLFFGLVSNVGVRRPEKWKEGEAHERNRDYSTPADRRAAEH